MSVFYDKLNYGLQFGESFWGDKFVYNGVTSIGELGETQVMLDLGNGYEPVMASTLMVRKGAFSNAPNPIDTIVKKTLTTGDRTFRIESLKSDRVSWTFILTDLNK